MWRSARLEVAEQVARRRLKDRMAHARCNRGERFQDEPALRHAGMRDVQSTLPDDVIPVEQDIQVDRTCRPRLMTVRATERAFDRLERSQQVDGREAGGHFGDAV
jgi:hypothetical protein